jgi:hypothetical protein
VKRCVKNLNKSCHNSSLTNIRCNTPAFFPLLFSSPSSPPSHPPSLLIKGLYIATEGMAGLKTPPNTSSITLPHTVSTTANKHPTPFKSTSPSVMPGAAPPSLPPSLPPSFNMTSYPLPANCGSPLAVHPVPAAAAPNEEKAREGGREGRDPSTTNRLKFFTMPAKMFVHSSYKS